MRYYCNGCYKMYYRPITNSFIYTLISAIKQCLFVLHVNFRNTLEWMFLLKKWIIYRTANVLLVNYLSSSSTPALLCVLWHHIKLYMSCFCCYDSMRPFMRSYFTSNVHTALNAEFVIVDNLVTVIVVLRSNTYTSTGLTSNDIY